MRCKIDFPSFITQRKGRLYQLLGEWLNVHANQAKVINGHSQFMLLLCIFVDLPHVLELDVVRHFFVGQIILTIYGQSDVITGHYKFVMLNDNAIAVLAGGRLHDSAVYIVVRHCDVEIVLLFD